MTVAEEIELHNKYENMGAQLVKQAASKTSDVAGDGTTTATVLAEAIYKEGLRAVTAGYDSNGINRGIEAAVRAVVDEVKKLARPVKLDAKNAEDIINIATHLRQQRPLGRPDHGRLLRQGRQGRRDHGRRGQEPGDRRSTSSRACSSTAAT